MKILKNALLALGGLLIIMGLLTPLPILFTTLIGLVLVVVSMVIHLMIKV